MTIFCNYLTSYAGKCGTAIKEGTRCKRHKKLPQRQPIEKRKNKYSGFSEFREETGEFQDRPY